MGAGELLLISGNQTGIVSGNRSIEVNDFLLTLVEGLKTLETDMTKAIMVKFETFLCGR